MALHLSDGRTDRVACLCLAQVSYVERRRLWAVWGSPAVVCQGQAPQTAVKLQQMPAVLRLLHSIVRGLVQRFVQLTASCHQDH